MKRRVPIALVVIILAVSGCKIANTVPERTNSTTPSVTTHAQAATTTATEEPEATTPEETTAEETTTEEATTEETTAKPEKPIGVADINSWPVFVVNEENPLPDDYVIETVPISQFAVIDKRCADYAIDMINAAMADGIELNVTSGYRSVEKQHENIEFYIERYMSEGYSYEEAERLTYSEVAKPGCSEHNAGFAMDIVTMDWFMSHSELTRDFEYTQEFFWLQNNSWKYGFIMSFPEGKSHITGFSYEPWHYRFVGPEIAEEIHNLGGITLNEYLELNND